MQVTEALTSRRTRTAVVPVLVPVAVMTALGLWGLDRGTIWRDEGATFQVARRSLPEIWWLLHHVDAVHGLYYLLMHPVLALHPGEVMLRLPSVAAAAAAAGLVAVLGARLVRPRVGLWAGLLYAITPVAGHYAQEGRSYAAVAAGAVGATLLLLRAVARTGTGGRAWWAYGAAVTGTALLHELAALLLLAHAATLLLSRVPRAVWRAWGAAAGGCALALLPLLLVSRGQAGQVAWLRAPDGQEADRLLHSFLGYPEPLFVAQLLLALCAVAAPLPRPGRLSAATVALPLLLVPPAVLFAVSQRAPLYHERYVLFALAGAPLLVAAGADRVAGAAGAVLRRSGAVVRPGAAVVAGVVGVVGAFWWQLPVLRQDRAAGHGSERHAAISAVAARELRAGDRVLYLPSIARRVSLVYPKAFRGTRDLALRESAVASGTLYGEEFAPTALARRLAAVDRVWVLTDPPALRAQPPREAAAERVKVAVLERRFRVRATYRQPGAELRLYVRR
ncbi:glycosyltransferase family 39 protein [Actinomycetota bacterium Odt1-20B]